ncbi:unnamed protein product [Amoebophrya sp. A25]|nr:unnamed protein product [Amoebophrya sp. A25]|eukprot:GSA25T00006002001.1
MTSQREYKSDAHSSAHVDAAAGVESPDLKEQRAAGNRAASFLIFLGVHLYCLVLLYLVAVSSCWTRSLGLVDLVDLHENFAAALKVEPEEMKSASVRRAFLQFTRLSWMLVACIVVAIWTGSRTVRGCASHATADLVGICVNAAVITLAVCRLTLLRNAASPGAFDRLRGRHAMAYHYCMGTEAMAIVMLPASCCLFGFLWSHFVKRTKWSSTHTPGPDVEQSKREFLDGDITETKSMQQLELIEVVNGNTHVVLTLADR